MTDTRAVGVGDLVSHWTMDSFPGPDSFVRPTDHRRWHRKSFGIVTRVKRTTVYVLWSTGELAKLYDCLNMFSAPDYPGHLRLESP